MHKSLLLFSIFCSVIFIGCKTEKDDPKQVMVSFMEAFNKQDFEKVKELSTEESKKNIDFMSVMNGFNKQKEEQKKFSPDNFKYGDVIINGKEAEIEVTDVSSGFKTKYFLQDENGWKVSLTMASIMKGFSSKDSSGNALYPELDKALEKFKDINLDSLSGVIAQGVKSLSHSQRDSIDKAIKSNIKEFSNVSQDSIFSSMEKKLKAMDSATKAKP
ncbi:MAG: hypothetical protein ABIP68_01515 [Ferruginibacter sp.]